MGARAEQPDPVARAQGEGVAVPAIAPARWIGLNPMIQERLQQSRRLGPLALDQGKHKPLQRPVEIMQMKLPEERPTGIVPTDRPRQLSLLLQKVKSDRIGLLGRGSFQTLNFQAA